MWSGGIVWDGGSSYGQRPRWGIAMLLTSHPSLCAVATLASPNRKINGRDHACTSPHITFGTYLSDSLQPGVGWSDITLPVDPKWHTASESHSGPGPLRLADTMATGPHGRWRHDAARLVRSSFMSTEVSLRLWDLSACHIIWILATPISSVGPSISNVSKTSI